MESARGTATAQIPRERPRAEAAIDKSNPETSCRQAEPEIRRGGGHECEGCGRPGGDPALRIPGQSTGPREPGIAHLRRADTFKCRGRESNPHAREGHPVLSRARLTSSATPAGAAPA